MRYAVILLLVLIAASPSFAQVGAICVYNDAAGSDCFLIDGGPGMVSYYVVHTMTPGATAIQFAAPKPACMSGSTYLGDTAIFPVTIGDSQTGVAVGYGSCLSGPIHVLTINYMVDGTTNPSCAYPVIADSNLPSGEIEMVDCNSHIYQIGGGATYFGGSPCECDETPLSPILAVDKTQVNLSYILNEGTFRIQNAGVPLLIWSLSENSVWLGAGPPNGVGETTIYVVADTTGLPAGVYNETVSISSNGGSATVEVRLSVSQPGSPILSVSPTQLNYASVSVSRGLFISNAGQGTLTWSIDESISWFSTSASAGSGGATVQCQVDRSGLSPGQYEETFTVNSNGGSQDVIVRMDVPLPVPTLFFSPTSLFFGLGATQQTLQISNSGTGDLNWSITAGEPWLTVNPTAGTNMTNVDVMADRTGLSDGIHPAQLSITSNGGSATINVSLEVITSPVLDVDPTDLTMDQGNTMKSFSITNVGVGTLNWTATPMQNWISVDIGSSSGAATVEVTVDLGLVPSSSENGQVEVTSNGGNQTVDVHYRQVYDTGAGTIAIYSDLIGVNCHLADVAGLNTYYVVHANTLGATASQWSAPLPGCFASGVFMSDTAVYPVTIGNSETGVAVGYGVCVPAPNHILTINVFGQGLTAPCCVWMVQPDPDVATGQIEVVNCAQNLVFSSATSSYVNGNAICGCTIATEETTWGRIKAMYADEPGSAAPPRRKR